MKKEFQIVQDYGSGGKGFLYIEVDVAEENLKAKAIEAVKEDWNKAKSLKLALHTPTPCRPTIHIREYAKGGVVRGGIQTKTKWR